MAHYKLSEVVMRIKDKVDKDNTELEYYIGGEHFDNGEICITKRGVIKESTIGPAFHMRFKPGDVLLMSRNPHLRKAGVVDFEGICSDVSYVCRTRDENVLMQRFLPFIFQTDAFWKFAEENKGGSTNFFLNWSDFERYEFDLPSIEEQRQLTEILWAAQNAKLAYKELLRQTDELVKSQFIELFGDPIKNEFNWPQQRLQDLVSADCSISYGIVKTGDDVPGGIPVFRPVDIVGKKPTIADLKRTTAEISAQYKRTLLKGRELLITVRANIGDTCIIGDEFAGCNVGRGIVPIRLNEDIMSLEFLKGQMDFESMSQHIKSLAKGVTLIQLNMEDLRMIKFIVPPVDLQNKYVSLLQQTDKSKYYEQNRVFSVTRGGELCA